MLDGDQLEVESLAIADGWVLRPRGEIDLSHSPSLRKHLSAAQQSESARLVIDLEEVSYMDSSGVATLLEALQVARKRRQKLILCALQERVKAIFEIARLDMVFTIVADRDEALTK